MYSAWWRHPVRQALAGGAKDIRLVNTSFVMLWGQAIRGRERKLFCNGAHYRLLRVSRAVTAAVPRHTPLCTPHCCRRARCASL